MRKTTKNIFLVAITLLFYGYFCRFLKIYFFWDSKPLGWITLFIGLVFYLLDIIAIKKRKGQKTTWIILIMGIIIFSLMLSAFLTYDFHTSQPYKKTTGYLRTNPMIKQEVGRVKGFGLFPTGSISEQNDAESGTAVFYLTIQGDKKYKDLKITVNKKPETDWTIISFQ